MIEFENVKKVYPIARYANERMLQLEDELAAIEGIIKVRVNHIGQIVSVGEY